MRKNPRGVLALSALALLSLGAVTGAAAATTPDGFLVHAQSDGGKFRATAGVKKVPTNGGGTTTPADPEPAAGQGIFSFSMNMAAAGCTVTGVPAFSGVGADTVLVGPDGKQVPMSSTGKVTSTYSTGKWTVLGSFSGFNANGSGCLTAVNRWTNTATTQVSFSNTKNLTAVAAPPATVTNMAAMFVNSSFNGDISNWNMSNVKSINGMFLFSQFNGDISKWDVSNVTDMGGAFQGSKFNGDLSNWNVYKVSNFQSMFRNAPFDGSLANWKFGSANTTSNRFDGMFSGSAFTGKNGNVNSWNVSEVKNFDGMFRSSPFTADLNSWNVSGANSMSNLFADSQFNGDISGWNPARLESANGMFQNAVKFNGNIGNWDMGYLMDAQNMFNGASSFTGDLSNWMPGRIYSEPSGFSTGSSMKALPTWR